MMLVDWVKIRCVWLQQTQKNKYKIYKTFDYLYNVLYDISKILLTIKEEFYSESSTSSNKHSSSVTKDIVGTGVFLLKREQATFCFSKTFN